MPSIQFTLSSSPGVSHTLRHRWWLAGSSLACSRGRLEILPKATAFLEYEMISVPDGGLALEGAASAGSSSRLKSSVATLYLTTREMGARHIGHDKFLE